MKKITSRDNQWVKLAVSLKQKKYRYERHRLLAEGFRLVGDAVDNGVTDGVCLVTETVAARPEFDALRIRAERAGWDVYAVTDSVYEKIRDTRSPQGIAAVLPFFEYMLDTLPPVRHEQAVLYLEGVQDPGNLGTVIRTAAAANAGAVLLSTDCVDFYNGKTVRSAMGAVFKVPVVQQVKTADLLRYCDSTGRRLIAAVPGAEKSYTQTDWTRPAVVAFGNEGAGLTADFTARCGETLTIPMKAGTESLNLAISVGIVLYKAWECAGFKE